MIVLMCWYVDDYVDVLVCWWHCVDDCVNDCVDVLLCWFVDVLMCWCVKVLKCWRVAVLMKLCRCVLVTVLVCCCLDVLVIVLMTVLARWCVCELNVVVVARDVLRCRCLDLLTLRGWCVGSAYVLDWRVAGVDNWWTHLSSVSTNTMCFRSETESQKLLSLWEKDENKTPKSSSASSPKFPLLSSNSGWGSRIVKWNDIDHHHYALPIHITPSTICRSMGKVVAKVKDLQCSDDSQQCHRRPKEISPPLHLSPTSPPK
jgi:hypothetical protein